MSNSIIARAFTSVNAPESMVWGALMDPGVIRRYMYGVRVRADWREGGTLLWQGEWKGTAYERQSRFLQFLPEHLIQFVHSNPLSGLPDEPGNYHTVNIELSSDGIMMHIIRTQDNISNQEALQQVEQNYEMLLGGLKRYVE
jgi:uncharacterized protein YndB with AHSA1/START domain